MSYNGLGQRLSVSETGQTTGYLVGQDGDSVPLGAFSSGQARYYLYGDSQLGEYNTGWNYYLFIYSPHFNLSSRWIMILP